MWFSTKKKKPEGTVWHFHKCLCSLDNRVLSVWWALPPLGYPQSQHHAYPSAIQNASNPEGTPRLTSDFKKGSEVTARLSLGKGLGGGGKVLGCSPAHCLWHLAEVSCISHWKSLISAPWWSHKQLPCKLRHQKKLTKLNIPSPARVHWNRFIFMRNVLVLGTKSFHFASNQHCTPTCRCCFFFLHGRWDINVSFSTGL